MGKLNHVDDFEATVVWRDETTGEIRHKTDQFYELIGHKVVLLFVNDLDSSIGQLREFNANLNPMRNFIYNLLVVVPYDITDIVSLYENKPAWIDIELNFLVDPDRKIAKIMGMTGQARYHEGAMMINRPGKMKIHVQVNSSEYPVTVGSVLEWCVFAPSTPCREKFKEEKRPQYIVTHNHDRRYPCRPDCEGFKEAEGAPVHGSVVRQVLYRSIVHHNHHWAYPCPPDCEILKVAKSVPVEGSISDSTKLKAIQNHQNMVKSPTIGDLAPEIKARMAIDCRESKIEFVLSSQRGRHVCILFVHSQWTRGKRFGLQEFNSRYQEMTNMGFTLLVIFTNELWLIEPWLRDQLGSNNFPIISDSKLTISEQYDVCDSYDKTCSHAFFIVDPDGIIISYTINLFDSPIRFHTILEMMRQIYSRNGVGPVQQKFSELAMEPASHRIKSQVDPKSILDINEETDQN